jgi:protein tyrosine/serine phosphatase
MNPTPAEFAMSNTKSPRKRRPWVALVVVAALIPGAWFGLNGLGYVLEDPSDYPGPAKFATVEKDVLYRSGMLSIEDFSRLVKEHGIKTVLCVRGGTSSPLQNAWFRRETGFCEQNGIRFVHAPMISADSEKNPRAVERFWELVDDPSARPILVHCEAGVDRTGVLSYLYRIHRQGWTAEAAHREMMELGASKRRVDPILEQVGEMAPPAEAPRVTASRSE